MKQRFYTSIQDLVQKKIIFQAGFTLVELAVTLTVIVFISTAAFVSFNAFNDQQVLQNAQYDVASAIETAKSKALSRVKPPACNQTVSTPNYPLQSYEIEFPNPPNGTYRLLARCQGYPTTIEVKSYTYPSTMSVASTRDFYRFSVGGAFTSSSGNITITIGGVDKTVTVTSTGVVRIVP